MAPRGWAWTPALALAFLASGLAAALVPPSAPAPRPLVLEDRPGDVVTLSADVPVPAPHVDLREFRVEGETPQALEFVWRVEKLTFGGAALGGTFVFTAVFTTREWGAFALRIAAPGGPTADGRIGLAHQLTYVESCEDTFSNCRRVVGAEWRLETNTSAIVAILPKELFRDPKRPEAWALPTGTLLGSFEVRASYLGSFTQQDSVHGGPRQYALQVRSANRPLGLQLSESPTLFLPLNHTQVFLLSLHNRDTAPHSVRLAYPQDLPHGLALGGPERVHLQASKEREVAIWGTAGPGAELGRAVQGRLYAFLEELPDELVFLDVSLQPVVPLRPGFERLYIQDQFRLSTLENDPRVGVQTEERLPTEPLRSPFVRILARDPLSDRLLLAPRSQAWINLTIESDRAVPGFALGMQLGPSHGFDDILYTRIEQGLQRGENRISFRAPTFQPNERYVERGASLEGRLEYELGRETPELRLRVDGSSHIDLPLVHDERFPLLSPGVPFQVEAEPPEPAFANPGEWRRFGFTIRNVAATSQELVLSHQDLAPGWHLQFLPGLRYDIPSDGEIEVAGFVRPPVSAVEGDETPVSFLFGTPAGAGLEFASRLRVLDEPDLPNEITAQAGDLNARKALVQGDPAHVPAPGLWGFVLLGAAWLRARRRR